MTFTAFVLPGATNSPTVQPAIFVWPGKPLTQPTGSVIFTAKLASGTDVASSPITVTNGKATWTPSPNLADGTYTVTAADTPDAQQLHWQRQHDRAYGSCGRLGIEDHAYGFGELCKERHVGHVHAHSGPAGLGAVPTGTVTVVDQSNPSLFNQTFTLDGTKTTFTFTVTLTSPPQLDCSSPHIAATQPTAAARRNWWSGFVRFRRCPNQYLAA